MTVAFQHAPHLLFALPGQEEFTSAFAIDCMHVAQVLEVGTLTTVPLAPPVVRGIINHNGRIVAAIEPGPLLGLVASPTTQAQLILLRRDGPRKSSIGLMVESVREIVPRTFLEQVDIKAGPCIAYVAQWKRRLIHVINLEPLLERLGRQFNPRDRGEPLGVVL